MITRVLVRAIMKPRVSLGSLMDRSRSLPKKVPLAFVLVVLASSMLTWGCDPLDADLSKTSPKDVRSQSDIVVTNWAENMNEDIWLNQVDVPHHDIVAARIAYRWTRQDMFDDLRERVRDYVITRLATGVVTGGINYILPADALTQWGRDKIVDWVVDAGKYLYAEYEGLYDGAYLISASVSATVDEVNQWQNTAVPWSTISDLPLNLNFTDHIILVYNAKANRARMAVVTEWGDKTKPPNDPYAWGTKQWEASYEVATDTFPGMPKDTNTTLAPVDMLSIPQPTLTAELTSSESPISAEWAMDSCNVHGTWDPQTGQPLTGEITVPINFAGDVEGAALFSGLWDPESGLWFGKTDPATVTLSIDGVPHTAQCYGVAGTPTYFELAEPGFPGPSVATFDFTGFVAIVTTDGSNRFLTAGACGFGSCEAFWDVEQGTWAMSGMTGSGPAAGLAEELAHAPVLAEITPSSGHAILSDSLGTIAEVNCSATASGTVLLAQYCENPGGPTPKLDLARYVEVAIDIPASEISWPITAKIYYSDAEVAAAGIDEDTLRLYGWNGSDWIQDESGVNVTENYVWANLSHCSPHGLMGDPIGVMTATGTGIARFAAAPGLAGSLEAVSESSIPTEGKPGILFPHGLFEFEITGLTAGQSTTLSITLPSAVPTTAQYWKYGPTPSDPTPHWYQIPMGDNDGDNVITITLTDGGLGDDDLIADGTIIDQGGPGWPRPSGGGGGGVPAFPSIYIGVGAALAAGVLAYFVRRRMVAG